MNFQQALTEIENGKSARRKAWLKDIHIRKMVSSAGDSIECFHRAVTIFQYDNKILNSTGWIVEGSENEIPFVELIPELLSGKSAHYTDWVGEEFIFVSEDRKLIYMSKLENFNFVPTFECLTANDWELF